MTKKHKPRSGSLAFYPRKRAKRETPSFKTFPKAEREAAKPLNFLGYKTGMLHVLGIDEHEKSVSYSQDITVPVTAIECPNLKVYGARAYSKTNEGLKTIAEITVEKPDKHFRRKVKAFKKKHKKREGKESKVGMEKAGFEDFEKKKEDISEVRLLVHTMPYLTTIGKKKPELTELKISGNVEQQLAYAKERFGNEIKVSEVFKEKQFVDVKAVDKGKGFVGAVKRFGIKMHRPKAKKRRVVGSIGPWNPSTVMWTVARPGQLGYQTRTEYNKRIIKMSEDTALINPKSGFKNYGIIKNSYLLLSGSVPGSPKRAIALREPMRAAPEERFHIAEPIFISTTPSKKIKEEVTAEEEEKKPKKVVAVKEEKKEEKSVEDEIHAAVKGEKEKREKRK